MGNVQRRRATTSLVNTDFRQAEKRMIAYALSQEDQKALEDGSIPSFLRRVFDPNQPLPTPTERYRCQSS